MLQPLKLIINTILVIITTFLCIVNITNEKKRYTYTNIFKFTTIFFSSKMYTHLGL